MRQIRSETLHRIVFSLEDAFIKHRTAQVPLYWNRFNLVVLFLCFLQSASDENILNLAQHVSIQRPVAEICAAKNGKVRRVDGLLPRLIRHFGPVDAAANPAAVSPSAERGHCLGFLKS